MATITTNAELDTAIQNWAARSDTAFTAQLDTFTDLTEAMFKRDPSDGGYRGEITRLTSSASSATVPLPSDFLEPYRYRITGDSGGLLEFVGREEMTLRFRTGSGKPWFYTISDVIELDVSCDTTYTTELSYYANVTALSGTASTNTILTNYPDIYLAGNLFHAHRYLQDPEGAAHWASQYRIAIDGANKAYKRKITSQGPIAMKPDVNTP